MPSRTATAPSPAGRSTALSGEEGGAGVPAERIEQRTRLRNEQPPVAATLLIRGGSDTVDKLRLQRADDPELDRLLAALSAPQPNSQYARGMIWRKEG